MPNDTTTRRRIESRILAHAPGMEAGAGDGDLDAEINDWRDPDSVLRPAAVLVPLVEHGEGLTVLLTQRTDHLRTHAGQVSFPGGRVEDHDRGPIDTALRETEEEIGLRRDHVEIAGYLDGYETGTGFHITPVVGFVRPGFALKLDADEVAEAFEVPLSFIFDPTNHQRHQREHDGRTRRYFAMPYNGFYIWGATAGMLMNLYRRAHDLL